MATIVQSSVDVVPVLGEVAALSVTPLAQAIGFNLLCHTLSTIYGGSEIRWTVQISASSYNGGTGTTSDLPHTLVALIITIEPLVFSPDGVKQQGKYGVYSKIDFPAPVGRETNTSLLLIMLVTAASCSGLNWIPDPRILQQLSNTSTSHTLWGHYNITTQSIRYSLLILQVSRQKGKAMQLPDL